MRFNVRWVLVPALVGVVIGMSFNLGLWVSPAPVEASTAPLALVQSMTLGQVDITDPEAVAALNEGIRPASEDLRATYYGLLALKAKIVDGGILAKIPAGGGVIQDGRESEGVTRVTADEFRKITTFANTFISAYEAAGVGAMQRPCVRTLRVQ